MERSKRGRSRILGVVAPGTISGALHTPNFRADETSIPVGIGVMTTLVLEVLQGGIGSDAPIVNRKEGS